MLNKRALYQMAKSSSGSQTQTPLHNGNSAARRQSDQGPTEYTLETVRINPISSATVNQVPDGRLSGKLNQSVVTRVDSKKDAITVSHRALRNPNKSTEGFNRNQVLQKLGSGSLGLLTNAYLEQQIMYDDEIHSVQQRFYGLQAV